jgi:hypothetical protein
MHRKFLMNHNTLPFLMTLVATLAATLAPASLVAQEDGSQVVLPEAAVQACVLPIAPPLIPYEPTLDQLREAKSNISTFQDELLTYRECLQDFENDAELTDGNRIAISAAYNYSVDMEERVANQFNSAVRDYRERQADGSE